MSLVSSILWCFYLLFTLEIKKVMELQSGLDFLAHPIFTIYLFKTLIFLFKQQDNAWKLHATLRRHASTNGNARLP